MQTARLAIVAASLGDPVAADMDAWLAANPSHTTLVSLERALAARGWAKRVAGADATAAITVDGARREVTLKPGEPVSIRLTPAQVTGARVEPVSGNVLVVTSWEGALDPSSLTPADGQALERTVEPSGRIGSADTVIVTLAVTLGPDAGTDCWRVTDLAPSGLAPIAARGTWDTSVETLRSAMPSQVVGQRVEFCVDRRPEPPGPAAAVRRPGRDARHVSLGTGRPPVGDGPRAGDREPATTLTIAGIGG